MTDFEVAGTAEDGAQVRLRVTGLRKTLKALGDAGADSEDLKNLMHDLGSLVVRDARTRTPVESGTLVSTLRAGKGKTKAVVRAGGARAPYAGVIHYGWPARNIEPSGFLTEALAAKRPEVLRQLDEGIGALLKRYSLK